MLSHLRALCFIDYGHVKASADTVVAKGLYLATSFGHQSVMIFFVLSGFLISSSILKKLRENRWSWRDYVVDRGIRLYTVLIPGLLLGWCWDYLGIIAFNANHLYSSPTVPFGPNIPGRQLSLVDFAGNLVFLQTRFVPVFGSNGPLWSLFNEFWYYALFPCIVLFLIRAATSRLRSACIYSAVIVLCCWILRGNCRDSRYGCVGLRYRCWLAASALRTRSLDDTLCICISVFRRRCSVCVFDFGTRTFALGSVSLLCCMACSRLDLFLNPELPKSLHCLLGAPIAFTSYISPRFS
jgi:peptidoglycan/LPS O-acetylase OafA/YrhL